MTIIMGMGDLPTMPELSEVVTLVPNTVFWYQQQLNLSVDQITQAETEEKDSQIYCYIRSKQKWKSYSFINLTELPVNTSINQEKMLEEIR